MHKKAADTDIHKHLFMGTHTPSSAGLCSVGY